MGDPEHLLSPPSTVVALLARWLNNLWQPIFFAVYFARSRENNIKVFHKPGRINLPRASCLRLYANYYANCIFLFHETINYLSRSHALSTFSAPDGTSPFCAHCIAEPKSNCCVISPFERTSKSPTE
jgi:hypothetical protein